MKILISCICEHAWVEQGCLSVSRAFDSVGADKFPYSLPRISLALRILLGRSEAGTHNVDVFMADPDGKKIMQANMTLNAQFSEEAPAQLAYSMVLNGQNVVFPQAGDYSMEIMFDGALAASIPLNIRIK